MALWRLNPDEIVEQINALAAETAGAGPEQIERMAAYLKSSRGDVFPTTWQELAEFSRGVSHGVLLRVAERIQAQLDGAPTPPLARDDAAPA